MSKLTEYDSKLFGIDQAKLEQLQKLFEEVRTTIPLLKKHYLGVDDPDSEQSWKELPSTCSGLYAELAQHCSAIRAKGEPFAVNSPLGFGVKDFPVPVWISLKDADAAFNRMRHWLKLAEFKPSDLIAIVSSDVAGYAAADLSESIVYLKNPCAMLLSDKLSAEELSQELHKLKPDIVFWMTASELTQVQFPASVKTCFSFNQFKFSFDSALRQIDILHQDALQYFAVATNDSSDSTPSHYLSISDHFHFDTSENGNLLITSLASEMLPLVRYDTQISSSEISIKDHPLPIC